MKKESFRDTCTFFFQVVPDNRKGFVWIFLGGTIIGLHSVGTVISLERITQAIELGNYDMINKWLLVLFALATIGLLQKRFIKIRLFQTFGEVEDTIDEIYLQKFVRGDNNVVEKIGTGRIISIYSKGVWIWNQLLVDLVVHIPMISIILFFAFREVIQYGWRYVAIGLCVMCLELVWIFLFRPAMIHWKRSAKNVSVEIDRRRVRRFMSKFEMLQQNKLGEEIDLKRNLTKQWHGYKHSQKVLQARAYDGSVFFTDVLLVAVSYRVGMGVIQGVYSYSDFVLLTGLVLLFRREMTTVITFIQSMSDNRVHLEKFKDLFADLGTMNGYDTGDEFSYHTGDISFKGVSYGYDDNVVFSDFSLEISGGKKTALVGVSGSGKSTLVKLITGFLTPQKGSIVVDGQRLSDVSLQSYYPHIGYLTQEPSVFDGTVRENLMYGLPTHNSIGDEKQIHKALVDAHCEFVFTLPSGLETQIGEKGIRLSGGQRQRLALAKVFLKNPSILILDEPTSSLDSFSEECITESLHRLFSGRTVLIIAHRLQTVKQADEILVIGKQNLPTKDQKIDLSNGTKQVFEPSVVLERGTHEELIAHGGVYANMLELQSGF